ncbi:MAG TPA: ATP-binding protein [Isosphaeraceae bacterium]|nr:ATP-binding protein [Isosphaeraceae bacterium]
MSLATRVSAFFLIALALVLAGFSGTLYLLARSYLGRELDERLQAALDTLEASVDIEPGGLEWEPADRQMTLGLERGIGAVRWAVRDGGGARVDQSANATPGSFPAGWTPAAWPRNPSDATAYGAVPGWRLAARRLELADLLRRGRGHPDDEPGYEVQYPALVLVVGLAPDPAQATLGWLGLTLAVLSTGIWAAAAVAGRWLCRRALAPLSRMAGAATGMTAADLGQRLPVPGTGDELDELGRTFNDLLDRLQAAFLALHEAHDRQHRFAGDASHQLRTPLAALLGQVQVALRRDRSPEDYRRVLGRIQDEGTRLRQIVESLLLLAQPDVGWPEPEVVDLAAWVPDHLLHWSTHPRAADLESDVDDGIPLVVRVHPPLLAQLVDNLLENACNYSAPGTPIVVRAGREGGSIVLGVEDRGVGLTAEEQTRVFEPFFRGEQARRDGQAGVGLGLAVAHRIAATFGGTLEVQSEPGVGSRFILRLPEAASLRVVSPAAGADVPPGPTAASEAAWSRR